MTEIYSSSIKLNLKNILIIYFTLVYLMEKWRNYAQNKQYDNIIRNADFF